MQKRILILSNNIGGLFAFRKEVIKSIVDEGYDVFISVPNEDERISYFVEIGCNIIPTPFNRRGTNPFADIKLLLTYIRMIKKIKPIVLLTYTIKPNVYGGIASRICKTPLLANVTGLGDAIENGGGMQKLTLFLYKLGIRKSKQTFFQNSSNRDFCIRHGIASDDSILLPGSGVNLKYHVFQKYPIETNNIIFLYIGRLMKDKGIEEFLETAKVIKKRHHNVEFQILGRLEGNYKKQLEESTYNGTVTYLGSTTDVRPYFSKIHCVIMPSYHEGMSNVNLESAANGRPVITTNIPGCHEAVDDGITGYLVNVRSSKSLINAVEHFIALEYSQKVLMGEQARKKVEKEFDRQIVIDAYLKEINKCLT